ncbi:sulfurtransferase [Lunatibacter salilacus]|uniref:sulfurtransferase n=1 Tax=Lunatibacter salilacus TaxID=2483804 RepID=UPI00131B9F0E|nr:sulfurtransferase [Lunatibacter salilacus]
MDQPLTPLIQAEELIGLNPSSYILVDTSFGKANYEEKHLKGAVYVDLNTQLSDIKSDAADGGRHPLPTPQQFSERLGDLGITPDSHVIVYDNKNGGMSAARFWWMMKAIGHKKIQVINGGLNAAIAAGFQTSNESVNPTPASPYPIEGWKLPLSNIAEVEALSQKESHIVVDVRETDRYLGKVEPIDLIAGHIPGAINIPFSENLETDGQFKSPDELKEKYQKAFGDTSSENIIVHCGSGVTACHTLLALAHAGMEIPKLYVGSWSEWSRNGKTIA